MPEIIQGKAVLTLKVTAGNVYAIKYNKASAINVVNYTDGSIFVSENPEINVDAEVGEFLVITDGNCYNEYLFYKSGTNIVYIKADADGKICIVRKQW